MHHPGFCEQFNLPAQIKIITSGKSDETKINYNKIKSYAFKNTNVSKIKINFALNEPTVCTCTYCTHTLELPYTYPENVC